MTYAAATSSRRELIFDPFPEFCVKKSKKDFDRVVKILNKVRLIFHINPKVPIS
jgi:hypothetical protein